MALIKILDYQTDLTSVGAGAQFTTPVSLDGALVVSAQVIVTGSSPFVSSTAFFQVSNDLPNDPPVNWSDYGEPLSVTGNANLYVEKVNPSGNWLRLRFRTNAGSYVALSKFIVKGVS